MDEKKNINLKKKVKKEIKNEKTGQPPTGRNK